MKDSHSDELRKQYLKTQGLSENEVQLRIKREGLSSRELRELERVEQSKAYLKATQPEDIINFASNRADLILSLYHKERYKIAMKRLNEKHEKILEQIKKPEVISEMFARNKNSSAGQLSEREVLAEQFKNAKRYKPG